MELRCPNASARTDEARSQARLGGGSSAMACISPSCWPTWVPPPSAFYLVSLPERMPTLVGPLGGFSAPSAHAGRATWCGAEPCVTSSQAVAGHRRCQLPRLAMLNTACRAKSDKNVLEVRGIDPRTSRMLSERSTI